MRSSLRKIVSWLMILIITFSSIQAASALDARQINPDPECHFIDPQPSAPGIVDSGNDCQHHSICITHCQFVSIYALAPMRLSLPAPTRLKRSADNSPLITRYPDQLTRPPKS